MTDYAYRTDIIDTVNIPIGTFASEGGTITFCIADDRSDLHTGSLSYYGAGSQEDIHYLSTPRSTVINSAILDIMAGSPADPWSVTFMDVIRINFANTDTNGNDTYDPGESAGDIVFGHASGDYPAFISLPATPAFTLYGPGTKQGDIWINNEHESLFLVVSIYGTPGRLLQARPDMKFFCTKSAIRSA
jgi:hypothetical protein